MIDGEEKSQPYVTSLEYTTDTATSNELEHNTSVGKGRTFSINFDDKSDAYKQQDRNGTLFCESAYVSLH